MALHHISPASLSGLYHHQISFNILYARVATSRHVGLLTLSHLMVSVIGSGIMVNFTLWWVSSGSSIFRCVTAGSFQKLSKAFIWMSGHMLAFRTVNSCLPLRLIDSLPSVLLAFARESWATSSSLNNLVSNSLCSDVQSSNSSACVATSLPLGRSSSWA